MQQQGWQGSFPQFPPPVGETSESKGGENLKNFIIWWEKSINSLSFVKISNNNIRMLQKKTQRSKSIYIIDSLKNGPCKCVNVFILFFWSLRFFHNILMFFIVHLNKL